MRESVGVVCSSQLARNINGGAQGKRRAKKTGHFQAESDAVRSATPERKLMWGPPFKGPPRGAVPTEARMHEGRKLTSEDSECGSLLYRVNVRTRPWSEARIGYDQL